MPGSYVGAAVLNSTLHVGIASTFTMESHLKPFWQTKKRKETTRSCERATDSLGILFQAFSTHYFHICSGTVHKLGCPIASIRVSKSLKLLTKPISPHPTLFHHLSALSFIYAAPLAGHWVCFLTFFAIINKPSAQGSAHKSLFPEDISVWHCFWLFLWDKFLRAELLLRKRRAVWKKLMHNANVF